MGKLFNNIRYYRELRGFTQDELAQKVGYSNRSAIARIERGDLDLPYSKILALAKALNVTLGQLIDSKYGKEVTADGMD